MQTNLDSSNKWIGQWLLRETWAAFAVELPELCWL